MTRTQINLAGKLWSLALIAHTSNDQDGDDEEKAVNNAVKRARSALRRMGVHYGELITTSDCVAKAKEMRP